MAGKSRRRTLIKRGSKPKPATSESVEVHARLRDKPETQTIVLKDSSDPSFQQIVGQVQARFFPHVEVRDLLTACALVWADNTRQKQLPTAPLDLVSIQSQAEWCRLLRLVKASHHSDSQGDTGNMLLNVEVVVEGFEPLLLQSELQPMASEALPGKEEEEEEEKFSPTAPPAILASDQTSTVWEPDVILALPLEDPKPGLTSSDLCKDVTDVHPLHKSPSVDSLGSISSISTDNDDFMNEYLEDSFQETHQTLARNKPLKAPLLKEMPTRVINTGEDPRATCGVCQISPIKGVRFLCLWCDNYYLCQSCERASSFSSSSSLLKSDHDPTHPLLKTTTSLPISFLISSSLPLWSTPNHSSADPPSIPPKPEVEKPKKVEDHNHKEVAHKEVAQHEEVENHEQFEKNLLQKRVETDALNLSVLETDGTLPLERSLLLKSFAALEPSLKLAASKRVTPQSSSTTSASSLPLYTPPPVEQGAKAMEEGPEATEEATEEGPEAAFVEHDNLPCGEAVEAGAVLRKIWRLKNTGLTTWPVGCHLRHVSGELTPTRYRSATTKNQDYIKLFSIPPAAPASFVDAIVDITVPFSGRLAADSCGGTFALFTPSGHQFGPLCVVDLKIVRRSPPVTKSHSSTPIDPF